MKRTSLSVVAAAAFALVPALAVAAPQFINKQAAEEFSSSGLVGSAIVNSAGEKLGDINYLVLDATGKVTTVVIGVGGVLGIGEKNVAVPFDAVKRQTNKAGNPEFALDATNDDMKAAPTYEWSEKSMMSKAIDAAKEKGGEAVEAAKEKAATAAETVKEKSSEAVDAVKESTSDAADATKDAAKDATK